mmetsp:Transcript_86/g.301  ORF Transcript_86/g.301 Transcript_86/m.301 type:complete len:231 (-) Transcript_86:18-710(-)
MPRRTLHTSLKALLDLRRQLRRGREVRANLLLEGHVLVDERLRLPAPVRADEVLPVELLLVLRHEVGVDVAVPPIGHGHEVALAAPVGLLCVHGALAVGRAVRHRQLFVALHRVDHRPIVSHACEGHRRQARLVRAEAHVRHAVQGRRNEQLQLRAHGAAILTPLVADLRDGHGPRARVLDDARQRKAFPVQPDLRRAVTHRGAHSAREVNGGAHRSVGPDRHGVLTFRQ